MGCGQKSFKLMWRCHQLLSGLLAKGHLPRVSRRSLMIRVMYLYSIMLDGWMHVCMECVCVCVCVFVKWPVTTNSSIWSLTGNFNFNVNLVTLCSVQRTEGEMISPSSTTPSNKKVWNNWRVKWPKKILVFPLVIWDLLTNVKCRLNYI